MTSSTEYAHIIRDVKNNPHKISGHAYPSVKLQVTAVSADACAYFLIKTHPIPDEVTIAAVKKDPVRMRHVAETGTISVRRSFELSSKRHVRRDARNISDFFRPPLDLQLYAVEKNPNALLHIRGCKIVDAVKMAAISSDAMAAMRIISSPTLEMQLKAVRQRRWNGWAIRFIPHPSDAVVAAAVKSGLDGDQPWLDEDTRAAISRCPPRVIAVPRIRPPLTAAVERLRPGSAVRPPVELTSPGDPTDCDICGGCGVIRSGRGLEACPCLQSELERHSSDQVVPSPSDQRSAAAAAIAKPESAELKHACVACSEPATHIYVACGHFCVCEGCVERMSLKCPVCRAPSQKILKVY